MRADDRRSEIRGGAIREVPEFRDAQSGLQKIFQFAGDLASRTSPALKNISVLFGGKSPAYCGYPVPKEGTSAVVTDVGTGCGGRGSVVARFMRADDRR
jgi:hypothetical protein